MLIGRTSFLLMLLLFAMSTVSIAQTEDRGSSKNKQKIEFPLLTLTVCESHGREFEIETAGDTANIKAGVYEDFGGTVLCFDWKKLSFIDAFVKFKFGAIQYLFDDQPARPLNVEMETGWSALELDDQSVLIPQSDDYYLGVENVYDHLGFAGREGFNREFERVHIGSIIPQSLKMQRAVYEHALKPAERKRLEKCCPEHIAQAEYFLNKGAHELGNLKGLSVEPYRAKTIIEIRGETKDGEQFVYRIVDENKLHR